jgi:hypothetical protein
MALALESHSLQVNCGMVAVGGVRMSLLTGLERGVSLAGLAGVKVFQNC